MLLLWNNAWPIPDKFGIKGFKWTMADKECITLNSIAKMHSTTNL